MPQCHIMKSPHVTWGGPLPLPHGTSLSSKQVLHHEMIEEEDKEVKLEESQKGYLPLSQNQKHHYHHRKEKKKKCWKCYSCNHLKRNFPYLRCFYCGFSSSFYSDKSYMLYPYTINEIIKDKYMVINILY